jgi:hypothetical protein
VLEGGRWTTGPGEATAVREPKAGGQRSMELGVADVDEIGAGGGRPDQGTGVQDGARRRSTLGARWWSEDPKGVGAYMFS